MLSPATREAIRNQLRNRFGRWKYRLNKDLPQDKDEAFAQYFAWLLRHLTQEKGSMEVISNQALVDRADGRATHAIRLRCPGRVAWKPGDLLLVDWQNPPQKVKEAAAILGDPPSAEFNVWSDGNAFNPNRRLRVRPDQLLRCVLDLSEPIPVGASWAAVAASHPRVKPRLYTVSRIPDNDADPMIEILISEVGNASNPGRASHFLTSLEPGETLTAARLPHPHRLPVAYGHTGPGICVVTGSGIAGVLAFLRAGTGPTRLWLLWGVRNRTSQIFYETELRGYLDTGAITRLDIAESRPPNGSAGRYVQNILDEEAHLLDQWLADDAWFYVSGHTAMGTAVRKRLRTLFATSKLAESEDAAGRMIADWEHRLRYVETTSG